MEIDKETLLKSFPTLLSRIDEEIEELRYLAVVDLNEYDPEIDDDFDEIDPEDYNYLVYFPERVSKAMGKELLEKFPEIAESSGEFENFLASEEDLFAVKCEVEDDDEVAIKLLSIVEEALRKKGEEEA